MTAWAVFAASLLGSLHCAAMCGGFAAMCGAAGPGSPRLQSLAYAVGRGLTYVGLGALAGSVGAGIDLAGLSVGGVQQSAALILGAMLIGLGLWSLLGHRGASLPLVTLGATPRAERRPSALARARLTLARMLERSGPSAALGVGLLSALLPCAWLWSFLAAAAATADPLEAAQIMLAFWAGTVPALAGVGLLAGRVGRRLGRHAPRIVAVITIALGAAAVLGRGALTPTPEPTPCHGAGTAD